MTGWASVSCRRHVRKLQDRLGERKLQHDLTAVIRHFKHRAKKGAIGAVGLQQFADHRPRNLPCPVGIAQFFAFRIGDQRVVDTGIKEVPRHGSKSTWLGLTGRSWTSSTLFTRFLAVRRSFSSHLPRPTLNPLIRLWFDRRLQNDVKSSQCSKQRGRTAQDFTGELFIPY